MQPARGLLYLTLKSARDLHKHDFFGKQQPYCQLDVGKVRVKARTCRDGGQNPEWDETLFFQLSDETEVVVTLFAEHQLSKDATIGLAVIPIFKVRSTGKEELSVPITLKGRPAGTLNVVLEFKGQPVTSFGQMPADFAATGRRVQSASQRPPAYGPSGSSHPPGGLRVASMPAMQMQQQASISSIGAASLDSVVQLQRSASLAMQQSVLMQQPQLQQQASADASAMQQQQQLVVQQQLQHLQMLQQQLASNLPKDLLFMQQQNLLMQQQLLGQLASAVQLQSSTCSVSAGREGSLQASSSGGGTEDVPLAPRRTAADLFPDAGSAAAAARKTAADLFQLPSEGSRLLGGSSNSLQHLDSGPAVDEHDGLLSSETSAPFSFDMSRLQAIIDKVYPEQALQQQEQEQQELHHRQQQAQQPEEQQLLQQPPSQGAFAHALAAAEAAVASEGAVCGSSFGFAGAAGLLAAEAALAGGNDDGIPGEPSTQATGLQASVQQPAGPHTLAGSAQAAAAPAAGGDTLIAASAPAAAGAASHWRATSHSAQAAPGPGPAAAADDDKLAAELGRLQAASAQLARRLEPPAGGSGGTPGTVLALAAGPGSGGCAVPAVLYPLAVVEQIVGEVTAEYEQRLAAAEARLQQLAAQLQKRDGLLGSLEAELAACQQELRKARLQPSAIQGAN